jgi:hypothetical protein
VVLVKQADLVEWLANPATARLVLYLRLKRAPTVKTFLQGNPVDPVQQGRAAAFHDIEALLTASVEDVQKAFDDAQRELKPK